MSFLATAASLALIAAVAGQIKLPNYGTVLQLKCAALNGRYKTAYCGQSCYIATENNYTVELDQWHTLHKHCNHLIGYSGHMAHIEDKKTIDMLLAQEVIVPKGRYYIGAKQDPVDTDECGGAICDYEIHKKNWFFFDAEGKNLGALNPECWLVGEPNNMGNSPPEHVVTLERFDQFTLGFNDANPAMEQFQVLCQYKDYLSCGESFGDYDHDYVLVGDKCYRHYMNPCKASEAAEICAKDGGKLASIHDDSMNTFLMVLARKSLQLMPGFRIGLRFQGGKWENEDGTPADYFRWTDQAGCGSPNDFSGGGFHVMVGYHSGYDETKAGYWTTIPDNRLMPHLCVRDPVPLY